jgi:Nucleotidyl transferase AbiEii toxin, Type IV TA system
LSSSGEPSIQDCLDAQAHFGLPSLALVQKDWHVIRAMQAVASVETGPFRLIFAGGTCLARGHRLVQRMSEDVDFKLVHKGPSPVSASSLRRQLGDLRSRVMASLQTAGFSAANQYPAYLADISGETRKALAALQTNPSIRQRYDTFAEAMVYGQRFPFDKAMQTIVALVNRAWPDGAHST